MALTIKVIDTTLESGGQKMIRGSILLDSSYPTGGETMDVSNWLKSGGSPTILLDGGSGAYVLRHNQGTSAAGKVQAFYVTQNAINGAVENTVLVEVASTADLSAVNASFVAVGPAY
jgi:hypothetical protein